MNKQILILLLVVSLILLGCVNSDPVVNEENTNTQLNEQPALEDSSLDGELEITDSELTEIESLINENSFEDVDFLELDESTFE